jgi:tetratricopeptide (TPR) repeat protein
VGDDAGTQSVIKTLHGHGYRFVAPLNDAGAPAGAAEPVPSDRPSAEGTSTRWWLPLLLAAVALVAVSLSVRYLVPPGVEGTKVAVLPLANETGEAELAWTRLGLMSLVSQLIGEAEGLDVVPDNDVVRLTAETEPGRENLLVERLRRAYAATHVVALELEREGGMLRLTFRLLDPDGRESAGTMLDADPTVLARGAARGVVSKIGGQARMRTAAELVSEDPFVNEAFARASALDLEGRCADARPLFQIVIDAEPTLFEPRYRYAACTRILGEPELAESLLNELVAEERARPAGRSLARALLTLGVVYNRTGRLDAAEAAEAEALEIAEAVGDHDLAGRILVNLSIVSEDRGDLPEARERLNRALLAYEGEGRDVLPGQIYSALSNLAVDEGDLAEADRYVVQALESFRFVGDRRNEAMMLNNRGLVKRRQGLFDEAESLHEASYDLRRELGDRVGMSRVKVLMAGLYLDRGQLEASIEAGREAAAIAEETRDRLFHAVALSQLGSAEEGRGNLDEARAHFDASREIFVEIQDRMRVLMTDILLAHLALAAGEDVEERAAALLAQARQDGYDVPEVEAIELLGDAAAATGRIDDAVARYREAMDRLEEMAWDAKETEVAIKLAEAYLSQDQVAAAEPLVGLVSARTPTLAGYRLRARYAEARGDSAAAAELMVAGSELGDERWSVADEALLARYRAAP